MVTVGFSVGSLGVLASDGRDGQVVDDLQGIVFHQPLQGFVIDVGVGHLALLGGSEMEYFAPG